MIRAVERLNPNLIFVLEKNGIKLGEDETYVDELSEYHTVHIRLSFKTGTPDNFELITNRRKEWFELQLKAAERLYQNKVSFHIALVADYAHHYLIDRLQCIAPELIDGIEYENITMYSHIRRRMKERGLRY